MFGGQGIPGSRQGCFKCGNLGHLAENCASPSRLCYVCKSEDHESANCPQPRTNEGKQCYACGGVGHIKTDCPSARNGFAGPQGGRFGGQGGAPGQVCFTCGRPGHIARLCNSRGGFRGGGQQRPRVTANADGTPVKCYRCNGENHLARDCLAPRDEAAALANKKCHACQELGHIAKDCPNKGDELAVAE